MTRRNQSRSTVSRTLVTALALALLVPASAAGETAAIEEYTLVLPGVGEVEIEAPSRLAERTERSGPIGVVGEQDDSFTPLAAVGGTIATPAGVVIVLALAAGIALAALPRGARG